MQGTCYYESKLVGSAGDYSTRRAFSDNQRTKEIVTMSEHTTSLTSHQDYRLLALSGKKGAGVFTKVDADLYDQLNRYHWHLATLGYPARRRAFNGESHVVRMHQEVMGFPVGLDVDHINGDKLDNRRCNLRLATRAQNLCNRHRHVANKTSRFFGVFLDSLSGRWRAILQDNKRHVDLGAFNDEEMAARIRDSAAAALQGEFATLNFPDETLMPYVPRLRRQPSSIYTGVHYSKQNRKWIATAYFNGGKQYVGIYTTEEEAHQAREEYLRKHG